MAIKNILVAYNGSESSDAALHAALLMHQKYDAHVTGLFAHRSAQSRLSQETWIPDTLRSTLDVLETENHSTIQERFEEKCADQISPDKLHWIDNYGDADGTTADYAMMYDITIVGRRDAMQGRERLNLHPDRIAVASGRPVLVVPRDYKAERIQEDAILAWDGQRAATRALQDAMQILETKSLVRVLTVEDGKTGKPLRGIDVETVLKRHDVEQVQRVTIERNSKSVAKAILDYCEDTKPGLLVMGAFETSMFREELFGGVTKDILKYAAIPVLIAH